MLFFSEQDGKKRDENLKKKMKEEGPSADAASVVSEEKETSKEEEAINAADAIFDNAKNYVWVLAKYYQKAGEDYDVVRETRDELLRYLKSEHDEVSLKILRGNKGNINKIIKKLANEEYKTLCEAYDVVKGEGAFDEKKASIKRQNMPEVPKKSKEPTRDKDVEPVKKSVPTPTSPAMPVSAKMDYKSALPYTVADVVINRKGVEYYDIMVRVMTASYRDEKGEDRKEERYYCLIDMDNDGIYPRFEPVVYVKYFSQRVGFVEVKLLDIEPDPCTGEYISRYKVVGNPKEINYNNFIV